MKHRKQREKEIKNKYYEKSINSLMCGNGVSEERKERKYIWTNKFNFPPKSDENYTSADIKKTTKPSRMNTQKTTPWSIIIKLLKTKNKEKFEKHLRGKKIGYI